MKFTVIVLLFGLAILDCNSQSIYQKYYSRDSTGYIELIDHKKINFLINEYSGQGIYKLKGKRIIVNILDHDKTLESSYRIIKDSTINYGYIIKGYVFDEYGKALPGVYLTYKIGRKGDGVITDNNGSFYKRIIAHEISEITVSFVGYTACYISPLSSKLVEYHIIMKEPNYIFLDNKIFKADLSLDGNSKKFTIKGIKIRNTWQRRTSNLDKFGI